MDTTQLIMATTASLFFMFIIGWISRFFYAKVGFRDARNCAQINDLAHRLSEAEAIRDQAIEYIEQQEELHKNIIIQKDAELHASMESLGNLRRELNR